jgi:two-component system sporulation sensor kinase B
MHEELDRAQNIITDFLTYAKPQLDDVSAIKLQKEIQYVMGVLSPYATMYKVETSIVTDTENWIIGDPQKFRQCLINIMKNCIEAMPNGGTLKIATYCSDDTLTITIQDTGIGMSEQEVKRLGSPYYSTKDKGTGLGMMVAFSIIKAMNGKITVHSEKGEGTEFLIILPKVNENQ